MKARRRVEFTGVELVGGAELAAPVEKVDRTLEKAARRSGECAGDGARHGGGRSAAARDWGAAWYRMWMHAWGVEQADGGWAVRRRWERADDVVIFAVREAASGRSNTLFQAFPFFYYMQTAVFVSLLEQIILELHPN